MPWWLAPVALLLGWVNGWCWAYDFGKRAGRKAGDRAHNACHEAQQAVLDQIKKTIDRADITLWEEEL